MISIGNISTGSLKITGDVGQDAFKNFRGISEVYFEIAGPITIGSGAFSGCTGIKNVYIKSPDNMSLYNWCNSTLIDSGSAPFNSSKSTNTSFFVYEDGKYVLLTNFMPDMYERIEDYCFEIGEYCFYNTSSITKVHTDASVRTGAFGYCKNLTDVEVSNASDESFIGCNIKTFKSDITTINNIGRVDSIGELQVVVSPNTSITFVNGFSSNYKSLGSVIIDGAPSSITIETNALANCANCNGVFENGNDTKIISIGENGVGASTVQSIDLSALERFVTGALPKMTRLKSMKVPYDIFNDRTGRTFGSIFGANGNDSIPGAFSEVYFTTEQQDVEISDGFMRGCQNIDIYFDGNITAIGDYGLYQCKKISRNDFSNLVSVGVYSLAESGFDTGDDTFVFSNMTSLGVGCFMGCEKLKNVNFTSNSITSVPNDAFLKCRNLKNIRFSGSITSIGERAFNDCVNMLTTTFINKPIETVGDGAFANCYKMSSFNFANVQTIGSVAFYECAFTSISLGQNLSTIGERAFYNCGKLKYLFCESNEEDGTVGKDAFYGCQIITALIPPFMSECFPNDNLTTLTIRGYGNVPDKSYVGVNTLMHLTILDNVSSIGAGAFSNCSKLKEIDISKTVSSIGEDCFAGCPIETASVPASIGDLLKGSQSLEDLTIKCRGTIAVNAFYGCSALKTVTFVIETGIRFLIRPDAFKSCDNITSVYTESIYNWCNISFANMNAVPFNENTTLYVLNDNYCYDAVTNVDLTGITTVYAYAFSNLKTITSVVCTGNSLSSIGIGAFYNCSNISRVVLPLVGETIGANAFYNCSNILEVVLPFVGENGGDTNYWFGYIFGAETYEENKTMVPHKLTNVTITGNNKIYTNAFYDCDRIKYIKIESASEIDISAFIGCEPLGMYLPFVGKNGGSENYWLGYIFGADTYSANAMCVPQTMRWLEFLNIPGGMTTIYSNAFYDLDRFALYKIKLPNTITEIKPRAFLKYQSLEHLIFADSSTNWNVSNGSTTISVSVSNSLTNATNITGQYLNYTWTKQNT